MSILSNVISTIAKPVSVIAPIVGGPAGTAVGAVATAKVKSDAERERREQIEIYNRNRKQQMAEIFGSGNVSTIQPNIKGSTANSGFGASFGSFLTDVGQNIVNPFLNLVSPFTNKFTSSGSMQPAVTTPVIGGGGQETNVSGTSDAFIGGAGNLLSGARSFLSSPTGSLVTGLLGGAVAGLVDPTTGKPRRITRKMKSQLRSLLNMTGNNTAVVGEFLGLTEQEMLFILQKRFRNDGPVVTKAALRKTKQTVKRLKSMCDMYDDLRPRARTTRRTPMRRASTTLISNK